MPELEFRFPSDQPYAYFNVRGTPEELAQLDFELLAQLYVNTQFAVLKGTVNAREAIVGGQAQPAPAEAPPGDPEAAAQRLSDGRKPRTVDEAKEMESQALQQLTEGLGGATEIASANEKPWEGAPKAPKAKPWENKKPATSVSADDFDF